MRFRKWLFILLALCLISSVTPASAFAGQTVSQTAEQVPEETILEKESDALTQAGEEPEKDSRSILIHIPFVCAVMIVLITGFIIWGKWQENREE